MKDVQATGEASKPPKKNIQHFKTIHLFLHFFYFSHLDPDLAEQNQCGSRFTTLRLMQSVLHYLHQPRITISDRLTLLQSLPDWHVRL